MWLVPGIPMAALGWHVSEPSLNIITYKGLQSPVACRRPGVPGNVAEVSSVSGLTGLTEPLVDRQSQLLWAFCCPRERAQEDRGFLPGTQPGLLPLPAWVPSLPCLDGTFPWELPSMTLVCSERSGSLTEGRPGPVSPRGRWHLASHTQWGALSQGERGRARYRGKGR